MTYLILRWRDGATVAMLIIPALDDAHAIELAADRSLGHQPGDNYSVKWRYRRYA